MSDFRVSGGKAKRLQLGAALSAVASLVYNTAIVSAGSVNLAPYGTASASSYYDSQSTTQGQSPGRYLPDYAINGDITGQNWGGYDSVTGVFTASLADTGSGWNSQTANAFPQTWAWNGPKDVLGNPVPERYTKIDIISTQDDYRHPVVPDLTTVGTLWQLVDFDVQYLSGASWLTVPNASVVGNTKVWRQFTFPALTTTAFRVVVTRANGSFARIVEFRAWTESDPVPFAPVITFLTPTVNQSFVEGANVSLSAKIFGQHVTGVTLKRNGSIVYTSPPRSDNTYNFTDPSPPAASYTYRYEAATDWGQDTFLEKAVVVSTASAPVSTYPTIGADNFDVLKGLSFAVQGLRLVDPGPTDINLVELTLLNEDNWNDSTHTLRGVDPVIDTLDFTHSLPEASGTGMRFYKPNDRDGNFGGNWCNNPVDAGGNQRFVKNPGDVMTMLVEEQFSGITLNTNYRMPDGTISSGKHFDWNGVWNAATNWRSTTSGDDKIVNSRWKSNHPLIVYRRLLGGDVGIEMLLSNGDFDKQPRMDQDGTKIGLDRCLHYRDNVNPENAGDTFFRAQGARGQPWAEPVQYQSRLEMIRAAPEIGADYYYVRYTVKSARYNQPFETVFDQIFPTHMNPKSKGLGAHFLFDYYTTVYREAFGSPKRPDGAFMEYRNYLVGTDWFPPIIHVATATYIGTGTVGYGWGNATNSKPSDFTAQFRASWDDGSKIPFDKVFHGAWAGKVVDQLLDEIISLCGGGHTVVAQDGGYSGSVVGAGWKTLQYSSFLPYREYPQFETGDDVHRSFFPDGKPFGNHTQDSQMLFRRRDGSRRIWQPILQRSGIQSPGPFQDYASYLFDPDAVGEKFVPAAMSGAFAIQDSNGVIWQPTTTGDQGAYIAAAQDYKRGNGIFVDHHGNVKIFDPLPSTGLPRARLLVALGDNWASINAPSCVDIIRDQFMYLGVPNGMALQPAWRRVDVRTGEAHVDLLTVNNPNPGTFFSDYQLGFIEDGALVHDWVVDEMYVFKSFVDGQGTFASIKMADYDAGSRELVVRGTIPAIASIQGNVHFMPRERGLIRFENYFNHLQRMKTF